MRAIFLVCVLAVVASVGFANVFIQQGTNVENQLEKILKNAALNLDDIRDLYSLYEAYRYSQHVGDKFQAKICNSIQKLSVGSSTERETAYAFYSLAHSAGCNVQIDKDTQEYIRSGKEKVDNIEKLTRVINLGLRYKVLSATEAPCDQLGDFIEKDGTTRYQRKKQERINYENTILLVESLQLCIEARPNSKDLSSKLKEVANGVASNLSPVFYNALAVTDGESHARTTGLLVGQLLRSKEVLELESVQTSISAVARFIRSVAGSLTEADQLRALFVFAKSIEQLPIINLGDAPVLIKGKGQSYTVPFRAETIYGQKANLDKARAQFLVNGKSVLERDVQAASSGDNTHKFDFEYGSKINALGLYEVRIIYRKDNANGITSDHLLRLATKAVAPTVHYEVTNSKAAPSRLTHEAKQDKTVETGSANQNSFIHVEFSLQFDNNQPFQVSQAGVKLVHPKLSYASNWVPAHFDKENFKYTATVDLGNPDHILAYNGLYEAKLIVGDENLGEVLSWTFARFNVTFRRPAQGETPRDTDYKTLPEIAHSYPPPRKSPFYILVLAINGGIVVSLLGFIVLLQRLGVNTNRLPEDFGTKLWCGLFVLMILVNLIVLVLFWVKINIFQTIYALAVTMFVAKIVGNKGLSQLVRSEREAQKKKTE